MKSVHFFQSLQDVKQVDVKYEGFEIPDEFVVGYGMDYDERFRNLPYIGILKREVYGG